MLTYPQINPIALHLGPLSIYWYGIMYLLAFICCWGLLIWRVRRSSFPRGFNETQVSDILFYGALGVIIGGRLGYMLFYDFSTLVSQPLTLFKTWKGGMSFHGGLLGVIIAMWLYAFKIKKTLIEITDFIVPVVPLGLAFGRIGNFINGELWGRATDVPWAMIFPNAGDIPRHPSQLYEFFFEGIILFIVMWIYSMRPRPRLAVSALFILLYGIFRFTIEFYREPDAQIGFVAFNWLTKGQLLSIPMIMLGFILLIWSYMRKPSCANI